MSDSKKNADEQASTGDLASLLAMARRSQEDLRRREAEFLRTLPDDMKEMITAPIDTEEVLTPEERRRWMATMGTARFFVPFPGEINNNNNDDDDDEDEDEDDKDEITTQGEKNNDDDLEQQQPSAGDVALPKTS